MRNDLLNLLKTLMNKIMKPKVVANQNFHLSFCTVQVDTMMLEKVVKNRVKAALSYLVDKNRIIVIEAQKVKK